MILFKEFEPLIFLLYLWYYKSTPSEHSLVAGHLTTVRTEGGGAVMTASRKPRLRSRLFVIREFCFPPTHEITQQ